MSSSVDIEVAKQVRKYVLARCQLWPLECISMESLLANHHYLYGQIGHISVGRTSYDF